MKHILILLISILLLSSPVIGQSERPETIVTLFGVIVTCAHTTPNEVTNQAFGVDYRYFANIIRGGDFN